MVVIYRVSFQLRSYRAANLRCHGNRLSFINASAIYLFCFFFICFVWFCFFFLAHPWWGLFKKASWREESQLGTWPVGSSGWRLLTSNEKGWGRPTKGGGEGGVWWGDVVHPDLSPFSLSLLCFSCPCVTHPGSKLMMSLSASKANHLFFLWREGGRTLVEFIYLFFIFFGGGCWVGGGGGIVYFGWEE